MENLIVIAVIKVKLDCAMEDVSTRVKQESRAEIAPLANLGRKKIHKSFLIFPKITTIIRNKHRRIKIHHAPLFQQISRRVSISTQ